MKEIIQKAEEYALAEIEKYGLPPKFTLDAANAKGEELAKKLKADVFVVMLGTRLMDLKLGEASKLGKPKSHVEMSSKAAKEFLDKFDLPSATINKVINCIEGHHKEIPWNCKEAEIAANADCYKFLLLRNWLTFFHHLGTRMPFEKALAYAGEKAEEKWNILSLDICKKELEPHYKLIKEIIQKARLR